MASRLRVEQGWQAKSSEGRTAGTAYVGSGEQRSGLHKGLAGFLLFALACSVAAKTMTAPQPEATRRLALNIAGGGCVAAERNAVE